MIRCCQADYFDCASERDPSGEKCTRNQQTRAAAVYHNEASKHADLIKVGRTSFLIAYW